MQKNTTINYKAITTRDRSFFRDPVKLILQRANSRVSCRFRRFVSNFTPCQTRCWECDARS